MNPNKKYYCTFPGCDFRSRKAPKRPDQIKLEESGVKISFHLVRNGWKEILKLGTYICSTHFKETCFFYTSTGERRIKKGAMPYKPKNTRKTLEEKDLNIAVKRQREVEAKKEKRRITIANPVSRTTSPSTSSIIANPVSRTTSPSTSSERTGIQDVEIIEID